MAVALRNGPEHRVWTVTGANDRTLGRDPSLAALQAAVGGYIEGVPCPGGAFLFVNEHGRLDGLPLNIRATALAGQTIVGDVVVCESMPVDDPED